MMLGLLRLWAGADGSPEPDGLETAGGELLYILACVCLVLLAGLASGLTLGLLSIDHVDIQVRGCRDLLLQASPPRALEAWRVLGGAAVD